MRLGEEEEDAREQAGARQGSHGLPRHVPASSRLRCGVPAVAARRGRIYMSYRGTRCRCRPAAQGKGQTTTNPRQIDPCIAWQHNGFMSCKKKKHNNGFIALWEICALAAQLHTSTMSMLT